ncbi:DNA ligase [Acrasis kona]|uniref:DNA ligase n=1 Tax=Acrasis kona TaxID=1008807 RepID=A0AAW2ZJ19_9EUKA
MSNCLSEVESNIAQISIHEGEERVVNIQPSPSVCIIEESLDDLLREGLQRSGESVFTYTSDDWAMPQLGQEVIQSIANLLSGVSKQTPSKIKKYTGQHKMGKLRNTKSQCCNTAMISN